MMIPKPYRIVDENHLEWVKGLNCAMCNRPGPSDPHHVKTRGSGGSDYHALPLCRKCHTEAHLEISRDEYWIELAKLLVKKLEESYRRAREGR